MKQLCLILSFLLLAAMSQAAILVPKDETLPPFELQDHQVQVEIEDKIAYTTITQEYYNPQERELEGMYIFPAPNGAKITEFAMWIAGKKMVGTVVERIKARRIYQSIVDSRRDPGILEEDKSNFFQVRVFPIFPKSKLKFQIAYTQEIDYEAQNYRYFYPLADKEDFPVGLTRAFSLVAQVKNQHAMSDLKVNGMENVTIEQHSDHHYTVEAISKDSLLSEDFELTYQADYQPQDALSISTSGKYGLVKITPPAMAKKTNPASLLFIIDASASMAKDDKWTHSKNALKTVLQRMTSRDQFNVVTFAKETRQLAEKLLPATAENIAQAQKFLDKELPLGPSNLYRALQHAHNSQAQDIVLISDGLATYGQAKSEQVLGEQKFSQKVSVLALGGKANYEILEKIAQTSQGEIFWLRDSERIALVLEKVYRHSIYPSWQEVTLSFTGEQQPTLYPPCPQEIYPGEQICLWAKFPEGNATWQVQLQAKQDQQPQTHSQQITLVEEKPKALYQAYWNYSKIDHLLEQVAKEGESKELVEKIIALSVANQIVTPYTAYLVLETEEEYDKYGIDRSKENILAKEKNRQRKQEVLLVSGEDERIEQPIHSAPEPGEMVLYLLVALVTLGYFMASRGWLTTRKS